MGLIEQAIATHRAGNLTEAESLYRRVLSANRHDFDALHMLGIICAQRSRFEEACEHFRAALSIDPTFPPCYHNFGNSLAKLDRYQEAIENYDKALAITPNYAPAYMDRGNAQHKLGQLKDALESFDKALALNPNDAPTHYNRGITLKTMDRLADALESYDRALAINPQYAEAAANRGTVLTELGRFHEALASNERSLALNPKLVEAWLSRAHIFAVLKRYQDAIASCNRASMLNAKIADPWLSRGKIMLELNRHDDALENCERALAIDPQLAPAWVCRGDAFLELKRYDEAFTAYDKALTLDPDVNFIAGHRLYAKLHVCDWDALDDEVARILSAIRSGCRVSAPFPFLTLPATPSDQLICSRSFFSARYPASSAPLRHSNIRSPGRIRLAYVSADFREHPVAHLLAGVFERHDRKRFETIAVSLGPDDQSAMRARLKGAFDRFIDAHATSDADMASQMLELGVDIAVDLTGYTAGCRPGILALRPAPIQINYLGYPGTLGTDHIDYIVADRTVIPEDDRKHYSEAVVNLPDSFMGADSTRRIAESAPSRTELGLPENGFVFCCFNNSYKLAPATFDIWMRLLNDVPGSVFWLSGTNARAMANLRKRAQARGVDPQRIVFAARTERNEDHLARLRRADLFLDTLPYNAHATAHDALWAGVPVLTCLGPTFAGRVAGSLLNAVGLPELVTQSGADYQALALKLARDPAALASIKQRLAHNRDSRPLFNTGLFTRNIETAYAAMWERHQRGEPPESFAVDGTR